MSNEDRDGQKTLTDEEIVTTKGRDVGRRKALHMASGAAALGAIALATGCRRRRAVVVQGGITDSDGGPCADPAGQGRGNSGITDSDGGQCADPAGRGRGGATVQVQGQRPYTGITDSDGGQYADPAGYGRGAPQTTGITDSDGGRCADPAGNGRGYSGCTDADGGVCADPAGRGRC